MLCENTIAKLLKSDDTGFHFSLLNTKVGKA